MGRKTNKDAIPRCYECAHWERNSPVLPFRCGNVDSPAVFIQTPAMWGCIDHAPKPKAKKPKFLGNLKGYVRIMPTKMITALALALLMRASTLAALLLVLLLPALAAAQPATSYQLRIYAQGGASPVSTFDIPATAVSCGLAKVVVGSATANPTRVRWDDPADATKDCGWTDAGGGPLFALPFSSTLIYEATLRATNSAGTSAESARSHPFSRPGAAPAAPAGLRLP